MIPHTLRIVSDIQEVDEAASVYFLVKDGEVVYVGATHNLGHRIYTHRHLHQIAFDSAYSIVVDEDSMFSTERRWILHFQPRYNRNGLARMEDVDPNDADDYSEESYP